MKQNLNPAALVSLLVAVVLIVVLVLIRALTGPSASPATTAASGKAGKAPNPQEQAHGPNEAELKRIREYLQAHPEAQSKYR